MKKFSQFSQVRPGAPKGAASINRRTSQTSPPRCAGAPHPLRGGAHGAPVGVTRQKAKNGSGMPRFEGRTQ